MKRYLLLFFTLIMMIAGCIDYSLGTLPKGPCDTATGEELCGDTGVPADTSVLPRDTEVPADTSISPEVDDLCEGVVYKVGLSGTGAESDEDVAFEYYFCDSCKTLIHMTATDPKADPCAYAETAVELCNDRRGETANPGAVLEDWC